MTDVKEIGFNLYVNNTIMNINKRVSGATRVTPTLSFA